MNNYHEWLLLKLEEVPPMLRKNLLYIYMTKMSIAWAGAFFLLLVLSCYEIRHVVVMYVFAGVGGLVGVILCVLMIFSMTGEVKEVVQLRELYLKFLNSLANEPGNLWNPDTKKALQDFQELFKRVCPEASINVPTWPEEPDSPESLGEIRRDVLGSRRLK